MLMVQRDKPLREYTSADLAKYFARKFEEVNKKPYQLNFAKDCSIMLKIMYKFHKAGRPMKDVFTFMDKMFSEYPKRKRIKDIDTVWLHGVTNLFLNNKLDVRSKKVKPKEVELDADLKAWLQTEKQKWLK